MEKEEQGLHHPQQIFTIQESYEMADKKEVTGKLPDLDSKRNISSDLSNIKIVNNERNLRSISRKRNSPELPYQKKAYDLESFFKTQAELQGKNPGRWSEKEHFLFLEGLKIFGKSWKKIANHIQSRTSDQVKSHCQKFMKNIEHFHPKKINESDNILLDLLKNEELSSNLSKFQINSANPEVSKEKSPCEIQINQNIENDSIHENPTFKVHEKNIAIPEIQDPKNILIPSEERNISNSKISISNNSIKNSLQVKEEKGDCLLEKVIVKSESSNGIITNNKENAPHNNFHEIQLVDKSQKKSNKNLVFVNETNPINQEINQNQNFHKENKLENRNNPNSLKPELEERFQLLSNNIFVNNNLISNNNAFPQEHIPTSNNQGAQFCYPPLFYFTSQVGSDCSINSLNRLYQYFPFIPSHMQRTFLNDIKAIAIDHKFSLLNRLNMIDTFLIKIEEDEKFNHNSNIHSNTYINYPLGSTHFSNNYPPDLKVNEQIENVNRINDSNFCNLVLNNIQPFPMNNENNNPHKDSIHRIEKG